MLAGCQVGPSCERACGHLAACVTSTDECVSICGSSSDLAGWSCVNHDGARACGHLTTGAGDGSCSLPDALQEIAKPVADGSGTPGSADAGTPGTGDAPQADLVVTSTALYRTDFVTLYSMEPTEHPRVAGASCVVITVVNAGNLFACADPTVTASPSSAVTNLSEVSAGAGSCLGLDPGASGQVMFPGDGCRFNVPGTPGQHLEFLVSDAVAPGTVIEFTLTLNADPYADGKTNSGGVWTHTFSYTTE
jgi:hypothetical protein